jgi:uncharacterized membrane protein
MTSGPDQRPETRVEGSRPGPLIAAGILLGTGLGGFVDGIVLHQILQWHNMLSSVVPPTDLVAMKYNMIWDGLFHAFTWLMTTVGVALLWRARSSATWPRSTRRLLGALALGWGLFNLSEGVIDHELLGIHHVHPGVGQLAWDLGFLAFGAALALAGWALIRSAQAEPSIRNREPGYLQTNARVS